MIALCQTELPLQNPNLLQNTRFADFAQNFINERMFYCYYNILLKEITDHNGCIFYWVTLYWPGQAITVKMNLTQFKHFFPQKLKPKLTDMMTSNHSFLFFPMKDTKCNLENNLIV